MTKHKSDKELEKAKKEMQDSLARVRDLIEAKSKDFSEGAKEKYEEFSEKAQEEIKRMKKEMNEAMEKAEEYVKDNPKKATAISASVGLMVGALGALIWKARKKK
ncbi:MAG: hypothetical protein GF332_02155 [Candidatus Moranbacteria bacterium]|nr:hypothetical protein [Candidatus Moranbacteria bacterium]